MKGSEGTQGEGVYCAAPADVALNNSTSGTVWRREKEEEKEEECEVSHINNI